MAAGRHTSVRAGRPRGQGQGAQRRSSWPLLVPGELRPGLGLRPGVLGLVPGARRRQRHRGVADGVEHNRGGQPAADISVAGMVAEAERSSRCCGIAGRWRTCVTSRCWPCRAVTPSSPSRALAGSSGPAPRAWEPARRSVHLVGPRSAVRPAGRRRPGQRLARGGLAGGPSPGLQADHPVLLDRPGPAGGGRRPSRVRPGCGVPPTP